LAIALPFCRVSQIRYCLASRWLQRKDQKNQWFGAILGSVFISSFAGFVDSFRSSQIVFVIKMLI